jgi:hypothetical protein
MASFVREFVSSFWAQMKRLHEIAIGGCAREPAAEGMEATTRIELVYTVLQTVA